MNKVKLSKNLLNSVLLITSGIILFFLLFKSWQLEKLWLVVGLLITGLSIIVAVKLPNEKNYNYLFVGCVLFITAGLSSWWITHLPNEQVSDFKLLYESAEQLLAGKQAFAQQTYFLMHPYQLGMVLYETIFLTINNSILFLQSINIIWVLVIEVMTYLIAKKLVSIKIARIALIFQLFNLDFIFLTNVLTNQLPAIALFMVSLWLFISSNDKIYLIGLAGFFAAAGNVIRPIGMIIVLAVVAYELMLEKFSKRMLLDILVFIAVFFGTTFVVGSAVKASGLSESGVSDSDPEWKLVSGLNSEHEGLYFTPDFKTKEVKNKDDLADRRAEERDILAKYLHENNFIKLFSVKLIKMWSSVDTTISWSGIDKSPYAKFKNKLIALDDANYLLMLIAIVGFAISSFKKSGNRAIYLLVIMLLGYIAANEIVEIQVRYRMLVLPIMAIIGAAGCNQIYTWFKTKILP